MRESEKRRMQRELRISRPDWYRKQQLQQASRFKTLKLISKTAMHLIAVGVIAVLLIIFVIGAVWSITQLF